MIDSANRMGEILKSMMPPDERRASNLALQARLIKRLAELQAELDTIPKPTSGTAPEVKTAPTIEDRLSELERKQKQGQAYGPTSYPIIARGFFIP